METRAYWEMTEQERRELAENLIGIDERFVVWKINHGHRLLEVENELPWEAESRRLRPHADEVEDCHYYDAIASLLFAAYLDGHRAEDLLAEGLAQFQGFLATAREEARALRGSASAR